MMPWTRVGLWTAGVLPGALMVLACGSGDANGTSYGTGTGTTTGGTPSDASGPYLGASTGTTGTTTGTGMTEEQIAALPPEEEEDPAFLAPVATGRYLWSANPESGRVALIDATTLTTRVLSAGLYPTYVAAVSSSDEAPSAVVLNVGSSDASYYQVGDAGVSETRIPVHVGANRWAVSDSGRWVAAWSQVDPGETLDPTEGLQELTLIDLSKKKPVGQRITVGYRPSELLFDQAESRLVAVSDQGISLIELRADAEVDRWVGLGSGEGRDVSVTSDGLHAVVRRDEDNTVEVITLDSPNDIVQLDFSAPVTDLDLADSGRAVAVVREEREVHTFLVDDVLENASNVDEITVPGEVFGSVEVSVEGSRAVLYTTAIDNDRVTIVTLEPGDDFLDFRSLSTQSPVQSVRTAPDGQHAITLGKALDGATSGAFAVLALGEERFPRIVGTAAPVKHVGLGNTAGIVTATSSTAGVYEAHLVQLPSLSVRAERLASPPLAAGIVADHDLGFAAQSHPEGRVTFFDVGSGDARTLTGFELSAEVVEE